MQIVSDWDNLHEMSNPVFWEKKKKKNIANLSSPELAQRGEIVKYAWCSTNIIYITFFLTLNKFIEIFFTTLFITA